MLGRGVEGREALVLSACVGCARPLHPSWPGWLKDSASCPTGADVAAVCVALRCHSCSFSTYLFIY